MNKSILALIAAVFVIGAALVVFNNQQTPEPKVAAERTLPALPAPDPSPETGDLQPLPKLPAPIASDGASVRAPVVQEAPREDAAKETPPEPVGEPREQDPQATVTADAGNSGEAEPGTAQGAGNATETAVAAADAAKVEEAPQKTEARPEAEKRDTGQKDAGQKDAGQKMAERKPAEGKASEQPRAEAEKKQARAVERTGPAVDTTVQPKITVFSRENGATVRVRLPAAIRYKQQRLTNPERIVIDINGIFRSLRAPGVPANPLVTNVRLGFQANNTTRVVVDLKEKPRRERVILSEDLQQLDIRVDR